MALFAATIDCPDPVRLARFYRADLGGQLYSASPDFVVLTGYHPVRLDFQRVANSPGAPWPDPAAPPRIHLDFSVEDLEETEQCLLALGAELASFQPGGRRFRVLLDPVGHPFCICVESAAGIPADRLD